MSRSLAFHADGQRLLMIDENSLRAVGERGVQTTEVRVTTFDASPPPELKK